MCVVPVVCKPNSTDLDTTRFRGFAGLVLPLSVTATKPSHNSVSQNRRDDRDNTQPLSMPASSYGCWLAADRGLKAVVA